MKEEHLQTLEVGMNKRNGVLRSIHAAWIDNWERRHARARYYVGSQYQASRGRANLRSPHLAGPAMPADRIFFLPRAVKRPRTGTTGTSVFQCGPGAILGSGEMRVFLATDRFHYARFPSRRERKRPPRRGETDPEPAKMKEEHLQTLMIGMNKINGVLRGE